MPHVLTNPWRGRGMPGLSVFPQSDASGVAGLLTRCPKHEPTPLIPAKSLAGRAGVAQIWIKDERGRMGLGSFKALGAAHAIARAAASLVAETEAETGMGGDDVQTVLRGQTFVAASAGNHGLSVAAGARVFGAKAVIYLSETVPAPFAERLASYGAEVIRAGADYEASMTAAETAARDNGWTLLSDSSWDGYYDLPGHVMEGYLQMAAEACQQIDTPPTHILLQAGVGGLAAAVAAHARAVWGDDPQIIVVEPQFAPALLESIRVGEPVTANGPVSTMGRLDCKTPSLIALAGLARDADRFATISEAEAAEGVAVLAEHGLATTPSGAAGLAALLAGLRLRDDARVLAILSEGPEDG